MHIIDPHSFAKTNDAVVKHLSWKANVDFATKTIQAEAVWTIEKKTNADKVISQGRFLITHCTLLLFLADVYIFARTIAYHSDFSFLLG